MSLRRLVTDGHNHVWREWKMATDADYHPSASGLTGILYPSWRCPGCGVVTHDPNAEKPVCEDCVEP